MYSETPGTAQLDDDIWNPNNWKEDDHEYRIYADDKERMYAVVDKDDYFYFNQWLWNARVSRGGRKYYLCRTKSGSSGGQRYDTSLYLHKEIQERKGIKPPSEAHTIADHRDGDSLNCRKKNLRWATPSMNRKNINGENGHDLIEDEYEPTSNLKKATQRSAPRKRRVRPRTRRH